jgi:tRNA pseudouridine55 synthase
MGLGLYWKERGGTSQAALGELKSRILRLPGKSRTGIGHTGTLDPFAEGILCVGVGEGTKLLSPLLGLNKTYKATFLFGYTSDMLDLTGQWEAPPEPLDETLARLSEPGMAEWLAARPVDFEQTPPQFSAIHVDGKRAHEWARAGIEKELKSRPSRLLSASHLALRRAEREGRPTVEWDVLLTVSSGTYIRSLARDWGQELIGFPGLLTALVREGVGAFGLAAAERPFRWLRATDCAELFELQNITAEEAEQIQRFGRWTSRGAQSRPGLLIAPSGQTVAWTEAATGSLGRVFLRDPFEADSAVDSPGSFV